MESKGEPVSVVAVITFKLSLEAFCLDFCLLKYKAPCTEDFFNWPNFSCFRLLQSSLYFSWVRGCKVGIQIYFSCGDSRRGFFLSSWGYHIRGEVDHLVGASCESGANMSFCNWILTYKDGGFPHFSGAPQECRRRSKSVQGLLQRRWGARHTSRGSRCPHGVE